MENEEAEWRGDRVGTVTQVHSHPSKPLWPSQLPYQVHVLSLLPDHPLTLLPTPIWPHSPPPMNKCMHVKITASLCGPAQRSRLSLPFTRPQQHPTPTPPSSLFPGCWCLSFLHTILPLPPAPDPNLPPNLFSHFPLSLVISRCSDFKVFVGQRLESLQ